MRSALVNHIEDTNSMKTYIDLTLIDGALDWLDYLWDIDSFVDFFMLFIFLDFVHMGVDDDVIF